MTSHLITDLTALDRDTVRLIRTLDFDHDLWEKRHKALLADMNAIAENMVENRAQRRRLMREAQTRLRQQRGTRQ